MSFCKWHREERGTRAPTCGEQAALGGYTGYSHDAQTSGKDWASGLRDHNRNCNGSGLIEIDVVWRAIVTNLYKFFLFLPLVVYGCTNAPSNTSGNSAPLRPKCTASASRARLTSVDCAPCWT